MANLRFKEKIVDWGALHDNLAPLLAELPHLAKDHTALAAILAEASDLESRQGRATAELRQVNQRRVEMLREGRNLRNRLAAGLQAAFGLDSQKLLEFRVKPRTREIRRRLPSIAEKAELLARLASEASARARAEAEIRAALAARDGLRRSQEEVPPAP